jgi:phosphoglycerate dehydrogenase-like enzyme
MTGLTSQRPRIVVLDDWERSFRRLGDWRAIDAAADVTIHHRPLRGDALLDALREADAIVLMRDRTPFGAELLAQLPTLRFLAYTGTRNNALDAAALQARGIPVHHTEWGPSKSATCELTWALILGAVKQVAAASARLRAGGWRSEAAEPLAPVLHGQRLGLIGLGEIGGRVAAVGRAFGMDVVTWSPHMTEARALQHGASALSLDELLATSAVVSLHLVPSAETRHLINAERLASMRPDSVLVNTSRASLIDTDALVAALKQGRPGAAALDVFDAEPLAADHPLREAPNLLLTPHLGFVVEPVFQRFASGITAGLESWLAQR